MWYIFDSNDKCIGVCSIKPSDDDLKTRNQYAIYSDLAVPIDSAKPSGDKVVQEVNQTTTEQLLAAVRVKRNSLIKDAQNVIDRYNNQKAINIQPVNSEETIQKVLLYLQVLRSFPETCDVNNPVWPERPW
jgi:hypothetical protein